MIHLISFGYKHRKGIPDVKEVDCRPYPNPHSIQLLRPLTGEHQLVQDYLLKDGAFRAMVDETAKKALDGDRLAFACIGGKHRSVAMAVLVGRLLRVNGFQTKVEHLDLKQPESRV